MGFYESKWLNENNLNKPKVYLRYVDDILAAFEKEQDPLNFLNFLDNKHPNIKLTLEKQVNHSIAFLDVFVLGIDNQNLTLQIYHRSDVYYFKLPYIGNLSHHIKNKLSKLCKEICKENFNIKLVFNSFKIKSYFPYKDPIPDDLKSFRVYKFTCVSCSSSYIGETCRHFKTRIEEHIKDNKSRIFKHLHSTTAFFDSTIHFLLK